MTATDERQTYDPFWEELEGELGQPKDGWLPDEDVIRRTRELLESLGNTHTQETDAMPDGETGAVLSFCVDREGQAAVLIFVNSELPSDLRVDLWGFCGGLAMGKEGFVEQVGLGEVRVRTTRLPITGRGSDLLGALMVRRLGRNTVGCRFEVEPLDMGGGGGGEEQPAAA